MCALSFALSFGQKATNVYSDSILLSVSGYDKNVQKLDSIRKSFVKDMANLSVTEYVQGNRLSVVYCMEQIQQALVRVDMKQNVTQAVIGRQNLMIALFTLIISIVVVV